MEDYKKLWEKLFDEVISLEDSKENTPKEYTSYRNVRRLMEELQGFKTDK